jgi:hypothetical protein
MDFFEITPALSPFKQQALGQIFNDNGLTFLINLGSLLHKVVLQVFTGSYRIPPEDLYSQFFKLNTRCLPENFEPSLFR